MRHRGGSEQPVKRRRANALKGRKVSTAVPSIADLQELVVQPTMFEVVINLKTAKALGLTVDAARRREVIK